MLIAVVVIAAVFLLMWSYTVVLFVRLVRTNRSAERAASARPPLSPYEVAWLAGRGRRVSETVLAGLVDRELVRVSRAGMVTAVSGVRRPSVVRGRAQRS